MYRQKGNRGACVTRSLPHKGGRGENGRGEEDGADFLGSGDKKAQLKVRDIRTKGVAQGRSKCLWVWVRGEGNEGRRITNSILEIAQDGVGTESGWET